MKKYKTLLVILILILIYFLGLFVRIEYRRFYQNLAGELPFTLESALIYRYALMSAENTPIPTRDHAIHQPGGFFPHKHLSLGSDLLTGFIYRILHLPDITFHDFLRTIIPLFFCTGIFAVFLITKEMTGNVAASFFAALFYTLAPSSIIRSTGIEFSRENFAIPLLLFHYYGMLYLLNGKKAGQGKRLLIIASIVAALLTGALILWDMTQFYIYILMIYLFTLHITSAPSKKVSLYLYVQFLMLAAASLINPYLKAHNVISSPLLAGIAGIITGSFITHRLSKQSTVRKTFITSAFFIVFIGLSVLLSSYTGNYSHFMQLLHYKLMHFNIRPADPALLPFEVRLLWTPALHSPFEKTFNFLPLERMIPGTILIILLPFVIKKMYAISKNISLKNIFFLIFLISSFMLYFLFTRFEVYLICFVSVFFGLAIYYSHFSRRFFRLIIFGFLVAVLLYQASIVKNNIHFAGRSFYYRETQELIRWIKEHTKKDEVFLASFGISPSILTYAKRHIILQPKIEQKIARDSVIGYATLLFSSERTPFLEFCRKTGATYLVYNKGTATSTAPYSWRYVCDALDNRNVVETIAYDLEFRKNSFDYFLPVYENAKFIVYRILSQHEAEKALELVHQAEKLIEEGKLIDAQQLMETALRINPRLSKARLLLSSVYQRTGRRKNAIKETKKALEEIRNRREEQTRN